MKKCEKCGTEYDETDHIGCGKCHDKKVFQNNFLSGVGCVTVLIAVILFAYGCQAIFGKYALLPFLIILALLALIIPKLKK
jgi:hypothetical protein